MLGIINDSSLARDSYMVAVGPSGPDPIIISESMSGSNLFIPSLEVFFLLLLLLCLPFVIWVAIKNAGLCNLIMS